MLKNYLKTKLKMRTKETVYEDCTRQHLGNNPLGTRMNIVYDSMEQYAKEYHENELLKLLPGEKDLAVELISRYPNGNNRGVPIAKKAFVDCYHWIIKRIKVKS